MASLASHPSLGIHHLLPKVTVVLSSFMLMTSVLASPTHVKGSNLQPYRKAYDTAKFNRSSFPKGFIFGAASASYQYEGAANEEGRGQSIWDYFTHTYPEKISDGSNGDVAVDQYHKYKEDVRILKMMGLDAYRLSISWPRILPKGKLSGGINKLGIQYYNNLINELLANGIQPFVTLFHWDLPKALDDEYKGFLSALIVAEGTDHTGTWNFSQASQKGKIGIVLVANGFEPYSNSTADLDATRRIYDFIIGLYLEPIIKGDYPKTVRSIVGTRLPKFTGAQSKLLKGSMDYIGLNYYTTYYAQNGSPASADKLTFTTDSQVNSLTKRNGVNIGQQAASVWLYIYPKGIRDVVLYIKNTYGNFDLYITENGVDEVNNSTLPLEQQLADHTRVDYYYRHLWYLQQAIKLGARVKGYFAWSLLDNFEWGSGYTVRFGINYVDYNNGLKRHPKYSALWFRNFLKKS
ncbi:hypothetical protein SAY87_017964 [Trapa incisa]|uniref:Beta-glucosidase n=1 Tax=Trapa incisa TaxID=236973 RepID=A0AAN7L1M0_9MYRT|nr:hypothetical protein SAY87_017964 [Trapa incisa]